MTYGAALTCWFASPVSWTTVKARSTPDNRITISGAPEWSTLDGPIRRPTRPLASLDRAGVDARFRVRGVERPDPGIVIVAVDDRTLGAINRVPPIPRGYYARAPDRLRAAGARLIVVDVQFIGAGPSRADDDALVADFGDPACPGNVNEACTVSEYVTVYDE